MKKAITIRADLYIESEDAPENNYAREMKLLARTMILSGAARLPNLKVTIKSVDEVIDEST